MFDSCWTPRRSPTWTGTRPVSPWTGPGRRWSRRRWRSSSWPRTGRTCTPGEAVEDERRARRRRGRRNPRGGERGRQLGADGTPLVAEFAPMELGVHLGMGYVAAATLVRDALNVRHRHPLLWAALGRALPASTGTPAPVPRGHGSPADTTARPTPPPSPPPTPPPSPPRRCWHAAADGSTAVTAAAPGRSGRPGGCPGCGRRGWWPGCAPRPAWTPTGPGSWTRRPPRTWVRCPGAGSRSWSRPRSSRPTRTRPRPAAGPPPRPGSCAPASPPSTA